MVGPTHIWCDLDHISHYGAVPDDWGRLRDELNRVGIDPTDLGRFVNNTEYFRPSRFDERSAMPVLLKAMPQLTDKHAITAVAGHLRRAWARPAAFEVLLEMFRKWAARDQSVGWSIGDALATAATEQHLDQLLDLAQSSDYGIARAMIVDSLWRYRKDARVRPALEKLAEDRDVCLPAMSALRRVVGSDNALLFLRRLRDTHTDPRVRERAARQVKRAERAAAKTRRGGVSKSR
jgi:hypothetical protein